MLNKIKVFLVDDHEIFRKGLIMVLSKLKNIEIVGEASNGKEFLDFLATNQEIDIVLIDIKMPIMNGIEATQEALSKYPKLKIIALTMFGDDEYIDNMLEAGAKGFILKNVNKDGLSRAINAVSENHNYFSEELLSFFTKKKQLNSKSPENIALTKRELEVLQFIAKGLSNQEIGEKLFISTRTVDGHKTNLIAKTESKNVVGLLSYALKHKLIDEI